MTRVRVRRRDQLADFEHGPKPKFACPYCGDPLYAITGARCACGAVVEAVVRPPAARRPRRVTEAADNGLLLGCFYALYLRWNLAYAPDEALALATKKYRVLGSRHHAD